MPESCSGAIGVMGVHQGWRLHGIDAIRETIPVIIVHRASRDGSGTVLLAGGSGDEIDDLVLIELMDVFLGWTNMVRKAELNGVVTV